jgi:predicted MPP superfamily phosphohydrolase
MRAYLAAIASSSVLLLAAHVYLYLRLIHNTTVSRRWRRVLGASLAGVAVLSVLVNAFSRLLPVAIARWIAWPGYLWWPVALYLMVALALLEVPRALVWLRRRARERTEPEAKAPVAPGEPLACDEAVSEPALRPQVGRRLVLGRSLAVAAGALSVGTAAYGVRSALGPPDLLRYQVPLRGLDSRLAGLRIAMMADIHVDAFYRRPYVERLVRMINGTRPDLVAIVGDLADGSVDQFGVDVAPLRDLRSTFGTYFVTGNHEYYYADVDAWLDQLRELGVRLLLNERVEIAGAGGFDLAGVNDLSAPEANHPGPDLDRALAGRDPARPLVLLAHQPVMVGEAARHGVDLMLAGHTHGGQMQPIGTLLMRLQQPSIAGWSVVGDTRMYVTRGAGAFGPPVRVGARPDITVLELQPGVRAW